MYTNFVDFVIEKLEISLAISPVFFLLRYGRNSNNNSDIMSKSAFSNGKKNEIFLAMAEKERRGREGAKRVKRTREGERKQRERKGPKREWHGNGIGAETMGAQKENDVFSKSKTSDENINGIKDKNPTNKKWNDFKLSTSIALWASCDTSGTSQEGCTLHTQKKGTDLGKGIFRKFILNMVSSSSLFFIDLCNIIRICAFASSDFLRCFEFAAAWCSR